MNNIRSGGSPRGSIQHRETATAHGVHRVRRARVAAVLATFALLLTACATAGATPETRQPHAQRIVAFGDVHGDLDATRRALRLAGAIDENDRWIGGGLVVVQTGDQLDRGDEERAILDLFRRLTRDAARAGGAFHALNGNHELMNVHLDLRYVTPGGFADFARFAPRDGTAEDSLLAAIPRHERGRVAAFRPGGPYARVLAERNTIVIVGDNVFVHGGVLPQHAEYGIDRINDEIRAWMRGDAPAPDASQGNDSPIWTRLYSQNPDDDACATAAATLDALGARRMIVGHTVHRQGITAYCDDRIWAIDVGLATYYGGTMQVLEIHGDSVRILR